MVEKKRRKGTSGNNPPPPEDAGEPDPAPIEPSEVLATPVGNWPQVRGRTINWLLENIPFEYIEDWVDPGSPFVLATPFGIGNYPPHIRAEIASDITFVIRTFTGDQTVTVFAPSAEEETYRINAAPFTYVARDMTPEARDRLLTQHVINHPRISFVINSGSFNPSTHIASIDGYNIRADDDYRKMALKGLVKERMMLTAGPFIAHRLLTGLEPFFEDLSPLDRANQLINRIEISPITVRYANRPDESGRLIWNILLNQPEVDDDLWLEFQELLQSANWNSSQCGPGVNYPGFLCMYCHGTDHPKGLCPFLAIPGWRESTQLSSILNFERVFTSLGTVAYNMTPEAINAEARRLRNPIPPTQTPIPPSRGSTPRGRGGRGIQAPRGQSFSSRGRGFVPAGSLL